MYECKSSLSVPLDSESAARDVAKKLLATKATVYTISPVIVEGTKQIETLEEIKKVKLDLVVTLGGDGTTLRVFRNLENAYEETKNDQYLEYWLILFKSVMINNLDNLSYYAQTSLRRTMEKYSGTCRFIMWCKSLSKVIEPLKSRCLMVRVPLPTDIMITSIILKVASKANIKLKGSDIIDIVKTIKNYRIKFIFIPNCSNKIFLTIPFKHS